MVVGLLFCGWNVPDGFEESPVVEPVDVFEGGVVNLVEVLPWSLVSNQLGLVQADDRLREGVIVRVAH